MAKFSYVTQRNTPCNTNAQQWYFINALNKVKTVKDPIQKAYYQTIVNYYLNGNNVYFYGKDFPKYNL